MNLDNLRKTAIEKSAQALRKFIDSAEEKINPEPDDSDEDPVSESEFDDFLDTMEQENKPNEENDDGTDRTQKFNIQDMLSKMRRKGEDIYQSSREFITNAVTESDDEENITDDTQQDSETEPEISDEQSFDQDSTFICTDETINIEHALADADEYLKEAKQMSEELKTSIEDLRSLMNDNIGRIEEKLIAMSYKDQDIDSLKDALEKHINSNASSTATINGKMSAIESKLGEISNSLSGISKLNDSIFDLKNAQMNSKNSIEELASSFSFLRKKCIAGVTVLSIVAVLMLIMEVINLLS